MATLYYSGNAQGVAEVDTFTPANVASTNTFTLTCNGKTVTFTSAGSTVAAVTAGLLALLNATGASAPPTEFTSIDGQPLTWTDLGTALQLTGPVGVPVTITSSASGGTAALTKAQVTAATGKSFVDNTTNYSTGSLPGSSDTLIVPENAPPILYGLAGIANTLTLFIVKAGFLASGQIGLPQTNISGYPEYRPTSLTIKATTCRIGDGPNPGSGACYLNASSVQTALEVIGGNVFWKGTSTSNTLDCTGGTVQLGIQATDDAKLATMNQSNGTVVSLSTVTPPVAVNLSGGNLTLGNGFTGTMNQTGGSSVVNSDSLSATALNVGNGNCILNAGGATLTALTANPGGTIDKSQNIQALTVTTITLNGGTITDPAHALGTAYVLGANMRQIQAA